MTQLRILICAPNFHRGGAERMSLQLFDSLDRTRFNVCMYVHERLPNQYEYAGESSEDIIYGINGSYHRWHLLRHLLTTLHLARKADVIIGASEGRASSLALLAGMILRRPVVLWLHVDWSWFFAIVSWRTRLAVRFFRCASAIVACSRGVADSHAKLFPETRDKLQVIRNCIDLPAIAQALPEELPDEMQELFNGPVIVAVGRLDRQKGHDLLIRAHALVLEAGVAHELIILGEGDERDALVALTVELGVADSVHLAGFYENPYRFMARATAFILASRFEGFGLVLAEALACAVPIISFDCPSGPAEILEQGHYGVLVPPQDIIALSKEITNMLTDEGLRRRLADSGPARAQYFGATSFAAAWSEILESVV